MGNTCVSEKERGKRATDKAKSLVEGSNVRPISESKPEEPEVPEVP